MLTKIISKGASELDYRVKKLRYINQFQKLSTEDQKVVDALHRDGIFETRLEDFAIPSTDKMLEGAHQIAADLADAPALAAKPNQSRAAGSHCMYADAVKVAKQYPDVYLWGLADRILNILDHYYGVPVCCTGVNFRRDLAANIDEPQKQHQIGTRFWHLDGEDRKVIKICIYLNDVDQEGGPFEYIPKSMSPPYRLFKDINYRVTDADMEKVVPSFEWKTCTGTKGTVIIADNAKIFHHGKTPLKDRYAIFYTYVSTSPLRVDLCTGGPWSKGLPFLLKHIPEHKRHRVSSFHFETTSN